MAGEQLPATKVDDARAELYAALQRVWTQLGWPAARAQDIPPRQVVPPAAFVDVPTLHQAPAETARAMAATFPLVFVTDGSQDVQVRLQDKLLAHAWDQLSQVKVGGYRATVQTAGPEDVDVGGIAVRGLVIRVQVTLRTETLCPQPLVQNDGEGTP
jgi:hypothetical protein